jgi:hypothetical protein
MVDIAWVTRWQILWIINLNRRESGSVYIFPVSHARSIIQSKGAVGKWPATAPDLGCMSTGWSIHTSEFVCNLRLRHDVSYGPGTQINFIPASVGRFYTSFSKTTRQNGETNA